MSLLRLPGLPASLLTILVAIASHGAAQARVPIGFTAEHVCDVGRDPASLKFAPDGRLFVGRRVQGELAVATRDRKTGRWSLAAKPFFTFDVPKTNGDPKAHRSSGLRDFAFDPSFATNGFVYAFYMRDNPRQNRVVRITQDPLDPSRALPGSEKLLLELPFNDLPDHEHELPDIGNFVPGRRYEVPDAGHELSAHAHVLPQLADRVSAINNPVSGGEYRLSNVTDQLSIAANKLPVKDNFVPRRRYEVSDSSHRVPAINNPVPSGEYRLSNVTDQLPIAAHELPDKGNFVPRRRYEVPDSGHRVPAINNPVPGGEYRLPNVTDQLPIAADQLPNNGNFVPGRRH